MVRQGPVVHRNPRPANVLYSSDHLQCILESLFRVTHQEISNSKLKDIAQNRRRTPVQASTMRSMHQLNQSHRGHLTPEHDPPPVVVARHHLHRLVREYGRQLAPVPIGLLKVYPSGTTRGIQTQYCGYRHPFRLPTGSRNKIPILAPLLPFKSAVAQGHHHITVDATVVMRARKEKWRRLEQWLVQEHQRDVNRESVFTDSGGHIQSAQIADVTFLTAETRIGQVHPRNTRDGQPKRTEDAEPLLYRLAVPPAIQMQDGNDRTALFPSSKTRRDQSSDSATSAGTIDFNQRRTSRADVATTSSVLAICAE